MAPKCGYTSRYLRLNSRGVAASALADGGGAGTSAAGAGARGGRFRRPAIDYYGGAAAGEGFAAADAPAGVVWESGNRVTLHAD